VCTPGCLREVCKAHQGDRRRGVWSAPGAAGAEEGHSGAVLSARPGRQAEVPECRRSGQRYGFRRAAGTGVQVVFPRQPRPPHREPNPSGCYSSLARKPRAQRSRPTLMYTLGICLDVAQLSVTSGHELLAVSESRLLWVDVRLIFLSSGVVRR
ncbi:hypothetical protein HPB47_025553, partial [Ixodes persulcatus]